MAEKKQEKFYQATGRRKESTASVRLFAGKGDSTVNGIAISAYFPSESSQSRLAEPFRAAETDGKFYFSTGCVIAAEEKEFRKMVTETHDSNNYSAQYKATIAHSKKMLKLLAKGL